MKNRKKKIMRFIEKHRFATRSMIEYEFFRCKTAKRCSQRLLSSMTEQKLINRTRFHPNEEYIYYLDWSKKFLHWLAVNEFFFQLKKELSSWQKIIFYDFEIKYGAGIADSFYIVKTNIDGDGIKFFCEIDRDNNNTFDKLEKYIDCYTSKNWQDKFWADPLGRDKVTFPLVTIWTPRPEPIKAELKRSKYHSLFRVLEQQKEQNLLKQIAG